MNEILCMHPHDERESSAICCAAMAMNFAVWSGRRVALVVIIWLVAVPLVAIAVAALYVWWEMSAQMSSSEGAGVGAVSIGIPVPGLLVVVWLAAPLVLIAAWAVL